MNLFGTNGIRGKIGEKFTPDFLIKVGMAIGTYLKENSQVIVGQDTRISGDMVKNAIVSGILAAGVNVVDVGIGPTPAVQLYTKNHGDFGIVITASHNPPEFNGVKAIAGDGTELPRAEERKIEEIFYEGRFRIVSWESVGTLTTRSGANEEYIERVIELVDTEKIRKGGFNVLLDCANGASCFTSPYLLERIGINVTTLNCQPDGRFPGHESEPKPENLKSLIEAMKSGNYDLGIAHDGDADRVVFVDERGNFVQGDKILALMADAVTRSRKGTVVTPVSSSLAVEELVRKNGSEVVYTKVGAPIVARKMLKIGAVFGGEENGGLIFPEMQYCRDGAMGLAKVLELMAHTKMRLSELLARVPIYHQNKMSVPCPEEKKKAVLDALAKKFAEQNPLTIDGVKISGEDWWVLIRPSGTEPIFRIYAEAKTEERVQELSAKFRKILKEVISNTP